MNALTVIPFSIALNEQAQFLKLPRLERSRILDLLSAFKTIATYAGKRGDVIQSLSVMHAGKRGFSAKTLARLFSDYIKSGYNWQVCVRNYRGGYEGQPEEFKNFLAKLTVECLGRTDTNSAVFDRLFLEYWRAGKEVPGYGTFKTYWDTNFPTTPYPRPLRPEIPHIPEGWSPRNISRIISEIAPRNGALRRRAAYGELKAHDAQLQVLRDRSHLKPLQLVTFDDVELDMQVLFKVGKNYVPRTAQAIVGLDVASGLIVGWGVRPILEQKDLKYFKEEDEKGLVLTRKEVNTVLLNIIKEHGLPANYPMRLLLENASATLLSADKDALNIMLPGRVIIEHTRLTEREFAKTGLIDKHGFPFQKGWLESIFKPLHIRLSHLPGATSMRFDSRHNTHKALVAEAVAIANTANANGINQDKMKFPLLTLQEFTPIFNTLVENFNARTNHKLQGFDRCYECYLPDGNFYRREELPAYLSSEQLSSLKFKQRLESPEERWLKLREQNEFTSVDLAMLYPLMHKKLSVKIRNHQIAITVKEFSEDKLYFNSDALRELEGKELLAFFTNDFEQAFLFTQDEGYVCTVARYGRVDITDQNAIIRQSGIVHRDREIEHKKLEKHLEDRANWYKEIRVHNQNILEENAIIGEKMIEAEERTKSPTPRFNQDRAFVSLENLIDTEETEEIDAFANIESFTDNDNF